MYYSPNTFKYFAIGTILVVAAASNASAAEANPSYPTNCALKSVPAVLCLHPKTAAVMWAQVRNNWQIINDGNNLQLLIENQCTRVRQFKDIGRQVHAVTGRGKVATQYGWIEVQMIDIPNGGLPRMYIAANYLSGPSLPDSDFDAIEAFIAKREKKPVRQKIDEPNARNMCREFILDQGYAVTEWHMLEGWKISRDSLNTWVVNAQFTGGPIRQEIRYQSKICHLERAKDGTLTVKSAE